MLDVVRIHDQGQPQPYSIRQLRADNPNVSFPASFPAALLAQYDVRPYEMDARPDHDPRYQSLAPGDFYQDGLTWRRQWVLTTFVPQRITQRQFIDALRETPVTGGTAWDITKAALATADETVRENWDAGYWMERTDPDILAMGAALGQAEGLTEAEVSDLLDDVFIRGVQKS